MTTPKPNPQREQETVIEWDTMSESERWQILHKTDLRGLQKCNAAAQPFMRLKSSWRKKIEHAYSLP